MNIIIIWYGIKTKMIKIIYGLQELILWTKFDWN